MTKKHAPKAQQAADPRRTRRPRSPHTNVVPLPTARALVVEKLASSGLTEADGKRLGVRPVSGGDAARLLGLQRYGFPAAMVLPYFDAAAKATGFFRVRGLGKPRSSFGEAAEPPKYLQPAGTGCALYLAGTLGRPWAEVLADPTVPLLITEGELKAAKLCAARFPALGLGGVDAWTEDGEILPELAAFTEGQRPFTIVFDADVARKTTVQAALDRLARALTDRGAEVTVAYLPPNGPKGADDFLVANGPNALRAILEDAQPYGPGRALREMNERAVYVLDPDVVVDRQTQQIIGLDRAWAHWADRKHRVPTANGSKVKSTYREWFEWTGRLVAARLDYVPGEGEFVGGAYNLWRPSGVEPRAGDVSLWSTLLDHLFQGSDPDHRRWFERWLAYPLQALHQRKNSKLHTAAILWSVEQGVGKDLVAEVMERIYGAHYLKIGNRQLVGSFNGWAARRQFIFGSEILGLADKLEQMDSLKDLITSERVTVNEKFIREYTIQNWANFLFATNHPNAFALENHDRRYFVHRITAGRLDHELGARIKAWATSADGAAALLDHLLRLDLEDFHPKAPAPGSDAKDEMRLHAETDLGAFALELREDPVAALADFGPLRAALKAGCDLFTSRELAAAFVATRGEAGRHVREVALGHKLTAAGIRQVQFKARAAGGHEAVNQRPYVLRNYEERWKTASHSDRVEHWRRYHPADQAPAGKKY